jgi:hypothetical protein
MNAVEQNLVRFLRTLRSPELGTLLEAATKPAIAPPHQLWASVLAKHRTWVEREDHDCVISENGKVLPNQLLLISLIIRQNVKKNNYAVVPLSGGISLPVHSSLGKLRP